MLLRLALSVVALGVFGVGLYLNQTEETYVVYSVPLEGEEGEMISESDENQIHDSERFAKASGDGLEKFEENKDLHKTTESTSEEKSEDPTLL